MAFIAPALQGIVLITVGCAGVYGIHKNANWPSLIGRKLIYIVNVVLLCCALVLSVTAVILSIIGGTVRHPSFHACESSATSSQRFLTINMRRRDG